MKKCIIILLSLFTCNFFAAQPNILIFLVDDMGLMDSSVPFLVDDQGVAKKYPLNKFYRTPSMERLAATGTRFSEFYAMSVCSPSRVSLMTGQTSARHHTTNYIKPESNNGGDHGPKDWQWKGLAKGELTLAHHLQDAGYRTIHAGKAHFGPTGSFGSEPTNLGFDVNIAGCAWGQPGSYYGKDNFGHGKKGREKRAVPGLEKYHGKDIYLSEAITIEMKAAITDAVKADQPFFAHMSHYAVHAPFQEDARFAANYPEANGKKRVFATMIEGMDKSLGDLLEHMEALGVANNTLVFFLGDNGSDAPLGPTHTVACAAPLRGKKGTHYEGGMRVPFIASWAKTDPKHPAQKALPIVSGADVSDQFAAIYDIFPTVLAATGVTHDGIIDGTDLSKVLAGQEAETPQTFLMHFPHGHRSSYFTVQREQNWKLIYHYLAKPEKRYELFNLATDPFESKNLADTQPERLQKMLKRMEQSLKQSEAQYPQEKGEAIRLVL